MKKLGKLFSKKKREYPSFIKHYIEKDFKINLKKELFDCNISVVDCETSGLNKNAKIITLGAIRITKKCLNIENILDLTFPLQQSSSDAAIHGELKNHLEGSISVSNIKWFLEFISDTIIAGHNIRFDISKINLLLGELYPGVKIKNKVIDTVQLEKRLDPVRIEREIGGRLGLSLDSLCIKYNIPIENRHTALGDAHLTALVLLHQFARLQKRGVNKIGSL